MANAGQQVPGCAYPGCNNEPRPGQAGPAAEPGYCGLPDPVTGEPHMLLVLKCFPPEHRIFELTMYNPRSGCYGPRLEVWTGSYKMEARKANNNYLEQQDSMKLARIEADQHWVPLNRARDWWPQDERYGWPAPAGDVGLLGGSDSLTGWLKSRGVLHWSDEIHDLDWAEHKEFKSFRVELVFDAPFMRPLSPATSEQVHFFLRSDDVKHVGWWKIGQMFTFSAIKKDVSASALTYSAITK